MFHVVGSHTSYHFLFISQVDIQNTKVQRLRCPAVSDCSSNRHGKYILSSLWTCLAVSYGRIERKNTFDPVTNVCLVSCVSRRGLCDNSGSCSLKLRCGICCLDGDIHRVVSVVVTHMVAMRMVVGRWALQFTMGPKP